MDSLLLSQCLECSQPRAERWLKALCDVMNSYDILAPARQAAFLAQVGTETGGLIALRENMNYSAKGLLQVFGKHFPSLEEAIPYEHNPERIGNRVYASRMGNGDEASGDGFKYRGGGLFQLTGKDAYRLCGGAIGLDLVSTPDLVTGYVGACLSAGWEWTRMGANELADAGDFDKICLRLNGGRNGWDERHRRHTRCRALLGLDGPTA